MFFMRLFTLFQILLIVDISVSKGNHFISSNSLLKVSMPVWSLSTISLDSCSTNMNIVTYSNQLSIKPEVHWGISLYKNTMSYENFVQNGWGVLQLLTDSHLNTIDLLGIFIS